MDRAPDLASLAKIEGELSEVEVALARLDEGTYGTCHICGSAIDDERLEAEPTATTCGEHATA